MDIYNQNSGSDDLIGSLKVNLDQVIQNANADNDSDAVRISGPVKKQGRLVGGELVLDIRFIADSSVAATAAKDPPAPTPAVVPSSAPAPVAPMPAPTPAPQPVAPMQQPVAPMQQPVPQAAGF